MNLSSQTPLMRMSIANSKSNKLLIAAAACVFIAALLHLGCIIFGGDWYRFLGAGEQMAIMAEQGHWYPTAVTAMISIILLMMLIFALSGAGVIYRLPLLRLGLVLISAVFIFRGLCFPLIFSAFPENSMSFWIISSGICLVIGLLFAGGTWQVWPNLKPAPK